MKKIKSHFTFAKAERSGILCILLLIIIVQIGYYYTNPTTTTVFFDDAEIIAFQQKVDSLKAVAILDKKPKIYPFNPNYITDYKGSVLGMSVEEIDRLHAFRATNRYVNSAKEFQAVTKVSDSLLNSMQAYFKFPEWVTQKKRKKFSKKTYASHTKKATPKVIVKKDINTATAEELKKVYGIGEKLSVRIVKYRTKLGEFVAKQQLEEVYGLKPEVIENLWMHFYLNPKSISKININTCTLAELQKIPYINYELADEIINQRTLREGFKTFEDLTKIQNFPTKKIKIIKLYLTIE